MATPDGPDDRTLDPSGNPESDATKTDASQADSGETLHTSESTSYKPEGDATFSSPGPIGPYRLVRKLGEGGMGQVWLAEQTAPLQRLVAIKLIRAGVADNVLLERFESERQALARMNHRNFPILPPTTTVLHRLASVSTWERLHAEFGLL